jgi:hypothetical protein
MRFLPGRSIQRFAVLFVLGLVATTPSTSSAQLFRRWLEPCVPCPTTPTPSTAAQPGTTPGESPSTPGTEAQQPAPSPENLFAQAGAGVASGPESAAPNMIGDLFGTSTGISTMVQHFSISGGGDGPFLAAFPSGTTGYQTFFVDGSGQIVSTLVTSGNSYAITGNSPATFNGPVNGYGPGSGAAPGGTVLPGGTTSGFISGPVGGTETFQNLTSTFDVAYSIFIPNPGSGGVVGRTKIAEDTSPIPRDRILFDYSFFDAVPLAPGGVNVHRFTPGFEKTFLDGMMSFEMKIPMAVTMDSTVVQDGGTDLSHGEFGDLAMTFKALLIQWEQLAFCGGLMVTAPTASDTNVILSDGTPLVHIANRSTHLAPFLGFLWTPNDKFFLQGFYQVDVEAGGCPVSINLNGRGLQDVGTLHDATYQYIDLGMGSWLYRGHERFRRLTGCAWTLELHGADSFAPRAPLVADNWQIGDSNSFDNWNLTVGTHLEFNDRSVLTLAYADPLGGHDRQFNGEFRLMFNYFFGTSRSVSAPEM